MPSTTHRVVYGDLAGSRVYLAGPLSGYPEQNRPAFQAAEAYLRANGALVTSPTHVASGLPYATCLRLSVQHLCGCDMVVFLPGWEHSPGAKVAYATARALGLSMAALYTANGTGCTDPRGLTWWGTGPAPHGVAF